MKGGVSGDVVLTPQLYCCEHLTWKSVVIGVLSSAYMQMPPNKSSCFRKHRPQAARPASKGFHGATGLLEQVWSNNALVLVLHL